MKYILQDNGIPSIKVIMPFYNNIASIYNNATGELLIKIKYIRVFESYELLNGESNTLLLLTKEIDQEYSYVFISGNMLCDFRLNTPVETYVSHLVNRVSFAYATTDEDIYFLNFFTIVPKRLLNLDTRELYNQFTDDFKEKNKNEIKPLSVSLF